MITGVLCFTARPIQRCSHGGSSSSSQGSSPDIGTSSSGIGSSSSSIEIRIQHALAGHVQRARHEFRYMSCSGTVPVTHICTHTAAAKAAAHATVVALAAAAAASAAVAIAWAMGSSLLRRKKYKPWSRDLVFTFRPNEQHQNIKGASFGRHILGRSSLLFEFMSESF